MSRRLVYVVGPSGAGKDSVLGWLRQHLGPQPCIHWARRTITRPARAGDELHEAVDVVQFLSLQEQAAFALHWQANGLHYGIRGCEIAPPDHAGWVIVNGSRGHLDVTRSRFPGLIVVQVSASQDVLRQRLIARGRESWASVEARIARNAQLSPMVDFSVCNDGELDQAGRQMLKHLKTLPGWPA
jgi:ribose 1,5-bisphosphokinase